MKKRLRILHGISEAAGQSAYSVQGLKELGYDAKMAIYADMQTYITADYALRFKKNRKYLFPIYFARQFVFFVYAILRFDIFHFHYGHSLLIGDIDLPILKLFRKKIFFEFHGSELRLSSLAHQINPYFPIFDGNEVKQAKRNKRRIAYADGIILHDEELLPHIDASVSKGMSKKRNVPIHIVPLRADPFLFDPRFPSIEKQKLIIVHAPSKRSIKGTEFVVCAIEELQKTYNFEFIIVESKPHDEAMRIFSCADIIVDQLFSTTYGVFSIEGMSLGKPVIVNISNQMRATFPDSLPLISANPDSVRDVIEELLLDGVRRRNAGEAGRAYAEKYHDYRKNAEILVEIYMGTHVPIRDT